MGASLTTDMDSRLSEFTRYAEIKQLACNVAALQQKQEFNSLTVLSFFPSEGKTLLTAALARAYAGIARERVLVVDTTSFIRPGSLRLRDCVASSSSVDLLSIRDRSSSKDGPDVIDESTGQTADMDLLLIEKAAADAAHQYGLVILDTSPLTARNKSNIDPLIITRLSGASLLLVTRRLLDSPNLNDRLKTLGDPALHLIGMVANEECPR